MTTFSKLSERTVFGVGTKCFLMSWRFWLSLAAIVMMFGFGQVACAQEVPGMRESEIVRYHENLAQRFKAGDTNLPLVRLNSFRWPLSTCSIDKSGIPLVFSSNGISNQLGRPGPAITGTNFEMLVKAINSLPSPSAAEIPLRRQLHISGSRSNGWFHYVYDLDNLPNEVRRLLVMLDPPFRGLGAPPARAKPPSDSEANKVQTNAPAQLK